MSLPLAAYEARRRLKGSVALAAGMSLLGLVMVGFFPSVQASGADLEAYLESLPPAFRAAFGVESFATVGGFLATELYQFGWVLLLGLYVAYRAGGAVAEPAERGRLDLLLSTPISRTRLLLETYASFLVPVALVNVLGAVAVYAGVVAVGESIAVGRLAMVHLLSVPYLLACAAIGLLLSVSLQRSALAERGALGAIFGLFLLDTVASISEYERLGAVSPTYYYDPTAVLVRGEYGLVEAGVLLVATAALLGLAVAVFRRVDVG